jgi:WD40 repeat protein
MIADDVLAFTFSPDGQALYVLRISGDQSSLSWLSLAADSPPEQLIASPYSGRTLRGNHRVLVIDHWNSQDGSGNLELVDLPSGARQVLAHAVTDLAGSGSADGAARVLYSVRGRFASGQDGLWETTLPAP